MRTGKIISRIEKMAKPPFTYSVELKMKLLQKGYRSLKEWCDEKGFPYRLTQKVVTKRTPAESGKALEIKECLLKEFGEEVLR
jgi:hypothetical protein